MISFFPSCKWVPSEDPILGLTAAFRNEPRADKVNLGVGVYRDANGLPFVLPSVTKAEQVLLSKSLDKEYLPITGYPEYVEESVALVFGRDNRPSKEGRLFATQSVGGTGALRVAGEYLALQGRRPIYVSKQTWPNHQMLFARSGLKVETFPYFDSRRHEIAFDQMRQAIEKMPEEAIILLHGCCHNPTGIDPSWEQWKELSSLIKKRRLLPLFDLAYQGFSVGLEEDVKAIRYFEEQGHELIVASSYAKNFGLYNERCGLLAFVIRDSNQTDKLARQTKYLIRSNYSNPPAHGARIVTEILKSDNLKTQWMSDLTQMRERLQHMREALLSRLQASGEDGSLALLKRQTGLFCYGLLTPEQVVQLRERYAIYMPDNGRLNVAGLNEKNLDYVVKAIGAIVNP